MSGQVIATKRVASLVLAIVPPSHTARLLKDQDELSRVTVRRVAHVFRLHESLICSGDEETPSRTDLASARQKLSSTLEMFFRECLTKTNGTRQPVFTRDSEKGDLTS